MLHSAKLSESEAQKLAALVAAIPQILLQVESGHDEIYGYRINEAGQPHVDEAVRNEILYKFLVASEGDVEAAMARVAKTLNWRAQFQPLRAAYAEQHGELERLGVISVFDPPARANLEVVTWNLYDQMDPAKLFAEFGRAEPANTSTESSGPAGSPFLRWRVGLMERALLRCDFSDPDNNRIAQVHDYHNVSMWRMDPQMKAATKEIITIFSDHYPELLSTKFFVNVPTLMSWMFVAVRAMGVISGATAKRFEVLNSGNVSAWFPGEKLPPKYGGDGELARAECEAPPYARAVCL